MNFIKKTLYVVLLLIPIGVVIGFSNPWKTFPSISIGGSSAMEPLLSALANDYSDADVSVVAGGSSAGIKYAALSQKDIGNASKNPYNDATTTYKQEWETKSLKTVTVAWDAIAIVYKPNNLANDLVITKDNILNLYDAFAGNQQVEMTLTNNEKLILKPYARTGGAKASGTAASFLNESGFDTSNINATTKNALNNGQYGSITIQTAESNIESWTRIASDNQVGSIIYLSLGFVSSNIDAIKKAGFKIAKYQNSTNDSEIDISTQKPNQLDQIIGKEKYAWFSPLNSIFSLNGSQETKDFIWWIFQDQNAKKIIADKGFVNLSDDYKKTMILDSKNATSLDKAKFFESSDLKLAEERKNTDGAKWYGAPK